MPGWTKNQGAKKDGEKILKNYTKCLAEKLYREYLEEQEEKGKSGDFKSRLSDMSRATKHERDSKFSFSTYSSFRNETDPEAKKQKLIAKKISDVSTFKGGKAPDAQILLDILNDKVTDK